MNDTDSPSPDLPEIAPHCLRCGAALPPYPDANATPRCPQCGLQFDPARPETWSPTPPLPPRLSEPGVIAILVFACVLGIALYSIILWQHNMGWALFFAIPISLGMIVGFLVPAQKWAMSWLILVLIGSVVAGLFGMGIVGIFCGVTVGLVFVLPMALGAWMGKKLRFLLVKKGMNVWGGQRYFCVAVLAFLPLISSDIEQRFPRPVEINEVSTSRTLRAPAVKVWRAVAFYEEVKHEPPFLLKLALPRPIRSFGDKTHAGNRVRCVYNKGYLVKRITKVEKERLLTFDVVEQHLHFEHDLRLRDGSFIMQPLDATHTRVVLTTRYERLTHPWWLWRWPEEVILHTMHEHVLNGMEKRVLSSEF